MKVLVLGGDGYLGWATAMHLSARGHEVTVADNYLRRRLSRELAREALIAVPDLPERAAIWRRIATQHVNIRIGDVADYDFLASVVREAAPDAIGTVLPEGMRIYGFGTAALLMGSVALWLLIGPPRGSTRIPALCAAVLAGPLPGWLVMGPRLAETAGLGTIDAGGWLALPAGLGRLLGAEFLAVLAPASIASEIKIAAAVALGLGLVASVFVLVTRSEGRGRGLAGFALACVLMWGAALTTALAPPAGPATAEARSEAAPGEDAAVAAGEEGGGGRASPADEATEEPDPPADGGSAF